MGDLKRWQKLALWAADNFPKNKLSQDLAYKIISDPQVGYQAGATTKDVVRNVFSSKSKDEDTNKYMFVYGADTRRPETTIGQAYDWSEDIRENGYENVKTYSGVLNPYNEYLVDSRNKGLVEEFAKVGYSPVSNINNEYIDWNTYRLKQGTPYFDDVHSYRPTFHFNNGQPVISSSDLYDFGKNYVGDFADLYAERSGSEKDPAFTMELQRRALNAVGQPYRLVQKNIPIRFVDNPQGNEIWRTNNFNKELRLDEMSDREISDILHTGYIEPSVVTAYKKGGRIHIKKKNRGKFTEYCGGKVTEECIARGKRSKNPLTRRRANFASVVRKWKHENGGILKAQDGTGNNFWSKLWNAVKEGGMAARDAKIGAVGAQQVRDLYSEGKNQEAQDLAKQYAKANTTGIALAGGAASTGLLGDLMVTGATTTADTFIDGDVDNFGKNLVKNAAGDLIGHGTSKLLTHLRTNELNKYIDYLNESRRQELFPKFEDVYYHIDTDARPLFNTNAKLHPSKDASRVLPGLARDEGDTPYIWFNRRATYGTPKHDRIVFGSKEDLHLKPIQETNLPHNEVEGFYVTEGYPNTDKIQMYRGYPISIGGTKPIYVFGKEIFYAPK